ncbi:MAG TPA: hypothetical protein VFV50_02820 [Bdellovibrionales bacterium]|nr:hypothetical protein [Bdellovibrionales bacterium]
MAERRPDTAQTVPNRIEFKPLIGGSIAAANRDFKPILKRAWPLLLVVAFLLELNHYLMMLYGQYLHPDVGPPLADFLAGVVASGTYLLLVPLYARDLHEGAAETRFFAHAKRHLNQLTIEMLRVLAKVILGLVLFVIPGLIWSVQLTFVPLIAQFDPEYLSGRRDALKRSKEMVRGHFMAILFVSLVFLLVSICETSKYYFFSYPPIYVLLVLLNVLLEVYVYTFFFSVYERVSRLS